MVSFCEKCFETHGDSHYGVGYTKSKEDAENGYRVMLELIRGRAGEPVTILDFGSGLGHFLEYLRRTGDREINYSGLDVSQQFLSVLRKKFPDVTFYDLDVLEGEQAATLPSFDYIIMNGIFTLKGSLTFDEMWLYFTQLLETVFPKARQGLAFNVMSKYVEWERDDLFHVPFDDVTDFLVKSLSRKLVFRHDYRPYEYTIYVYR